jgi:hypothetical protein
MSIGTSSCGHNLSAAQLLLVITQIALMKPLKHGEMDFPPIETETESKGFSFACIIRALTQSLGRNDITIFVCP